MNSGIEYDNMFWEIKQISPKLSERMDLLKQRELKK